MDGLFRDGALTVGLVLPVRVGERQPDVAEQLEAAALADSLGFAAIWVRDVPLNGAWYPEPFGHPDPFAMLGAVAARTTRIALGTAATVLPLRDPLHVAKAAITLDLMSGGRFVLGLGSGDRREEFAAFGHEATDAKDLHRGHWERLAAALERPSRVVPAGDGNGVDYALWPAPERDIPMLAVGSGGQTLEWIARNAAGWATYHRPRERQKDRHALWRGAVERVAPGAFRSFSVALRVELDADPHAPATDIDLGYRTGILNLRPILEALRADGVHHAMLNLAPGGTAIADTLARVAEHVFAGGPILSTHA